MLRPASSINRPLVRHLKITDYQETWQQMKGFTDRRDAQTTDQIWITEHAPVFTQGQNGKPEHLLNTGDIPVIQTDRGGQTTYHGPGQLLVYCLLDIVRLGWGVRGLVTRIESSIIHFLANYGIHSSTIAKSPGVYVKGAKIAALGLRIRKGCCYHGFSLNIDMDLNPFTRINPCGYNNLEITQLADFQIRMAPAQAGSELTELLIQRLHQPTANHHHSNRMRNYG